MTFERKLFLTFVVVSLLLLICMPFVLDEPEFVFGQATSGISTGLFPSLAAAGILVTSVVELAKSVGYGEGPETKAPKETGLGGSTIVPFVLVLSAATMFDFFGYVATTAVVAALLSLTMGNRRLLSFVVVSLVFPLSMYWLFTYVFSIYLPVGDIFHELLP